MESELDFLDDNFCNFHVPNLVPKGRDPFGQRRGSRSLAKTNTGSVRFTDFP